MGLFDFVSDIGAKIFGDDSEAAEKIKEHILADGLPISDLDVAFDDGLVTLTGTAETADAKEKAILLAGNVEGVNDVNAEGLEAPEQTNNVEFYVIKKGDTLSGIAKEYYGDAMKYPVIFEANKEVIKNADLIYPGQNIRIPLDA